MSQLNLWRVTYELHESMEDGPGDFLSRNERGTKYVAIKGRDLVDVERALLSEPAHNISGHVDIERAEFMGVVEVERNTKP